MKFTTSLLAIVLLLAVTVAGCSKRREVDQEKRERLFNACLDKVRDTGVKEDVVSDCLHAATEMSYKY